MIHHTKSKGDIGVTKVIADLTTKRLYVCLPISEHLPFDLIAIRENGLCIKISVKYREMRNGTVTVALKSSYADKNGSHDKKIDKSLIDLIAIYCPESNEVYYINPSNYKESITLRILPVKNNQSKGILLAKNYMVP